jgi:Fe2+ or Zn2+ uptake regulation protein
MDAQEQIRSLVEAFRDSGRRWTPQRQAIVEILWRLPNHPTAEEIFVSVRRRHPGMSRATVYNTMETLASMGRIATVRAADGTRRYDPNPDPHHHLRCRVCGLIVDLHEGSFVPAPQIPAGQSHGFRIESVQIEYHGICPACDRAKPPDPGRAQGQGKSPTTERAARSRS